MHLCKVRFLSTQLANLLASRPDLPSLQPGVKIQWCQVPTQILIPALPSLAASKHTFTFCSANSSILQVQSTQTETESKTRSKSSLSCSTSSPLMIISAKILTPGIPPFPSLIPFVFQFPSLHLHLTSSSRHKASPVMHF